MANGATPRGIKILAIFQRKGEIMSILVWCKPQKKKKPKKPKMSLQIETSPKEITTCYRFEFVE